MGSWQQAVGRSGFVRTACVSGRVLLFTERAICQATQKQATLKFEIRIPKFEILKLRLLSCDALCASGRRSSVASCAARSWHLSTNTWLTFPRAR